MIDDPTIGPSSKGAAASLASLGLPQSHRASAMRWRAAAWIPIPLCLALTIWFKLKGLETRSIDAEWIAGLTAIFSTGISFFIAVIAARNYRTSGSLPVLCLGCGTLAVGLGTSISVYALFHRQYGIGVMLAIGTLCQLLSGLCHVMGAVGALRPAGPRAGRSTALPLYLSYWSVIGLLALLTVGSSTQIIPSFGTVRGGSAIMQIVMIGAAIAYTLAAVILRESYRRTRSDFFHFYSLSLALIASGLISVLIINRLQDPATWVGRMGIYLGGIYLLGAVLAAVRESGGWSRALQNALQESQRRYDLLFSTAVDGVLIQDFSNAGQIGRIVAANPAICEMLGYSPEEFAASSVIRFLDSAGAGQSGSTSEMNALSSEGKLLHEKMLVARDGRRISAEITTRVFESEGKRMALSIIRDVTRRKHAEQALRSSEQGLRELADAMPQLVWTATADGTLSYYNNKGFEQFRIETGGERDGHILLHPDDHERTWNGWKAALATGAPYEMEHRFELRDGSHRWFLSRAMPYPDAMGSGLKWYGTTTDIHMQKEAEETLRSAHDQLELRVDERTAELRRSAGELRGRNEQLARLSSDLIMAEQRERRRLAALLHDHLQQLLVGAIFGLQVLARRFTGEAENPVDRILDLLNESLKASRSLTVELSPPILHDAGMGAGLEWLARNMQEKQGLTVELELDPVADTPREDLRILLFQSVRELLFNIVKHAGVTNAHVSLQREGDALRIDVRDAGKGFDPAEPAKAASASGTGLGLLSIRERLIQLGGRFDVKSAPGKGTAFTLIAPLEMPVAATRAVQSGAGIKEFQSGYSAPHQTSADYSAARANDESGAFDAAPPIRVLLVDDHVVMRQGLSLLLNEERDIKVIGEASDGLEAIEQARRLTPDVILMDFSMPRMDGVEATRRIHLEFPDIRIVGLSMYDAADRAAAMQHAGATAYVKKSGDPASLLGAIRDESQGAIV